MPHDVLRTPASPIPRCTEEVRRLAKDLIETMRAHRGVGLAAPQVGCGVQLFVADDVDHPGEALVVMNPRVESASGRTAMVEGCLSLPDVWEEVPRASYIRLSGCHLSGERFSLDAEGLLAIIIQHEVDHLQGRLIMDRLPEARRRAVAHARSV